jgi:hypothetical protein
VVGKWFALAFAYDAATGAFESYVDGGFVCHGHLPVYGRPYLMRLLGDQLRNTLRASATLPFMRKLTFDNMVLAPAADRRPPTRPRTSRSSVASIALRTLASEEYGRYVTGERGQQATVARSHKADAAFRPRTMKAHALFIFTGLARASALTVVTNRIPTSSRAVASVVVRVQVNSGDRVQDIRAGARRQAIRWV